jgi:hypothetical protein
MHEVKKSKNVMECAIGGWTYSDANVKENGLFNLPAFLSFSIFISESLKALLAVVLCVGRELPEHVPRGYRFVCVL